MNDHEKLLTLFLASTIHEAKNHLGGLAHWVTQICDQFPQAPQVSEAKTQIIRLQQSLNQVLTHYRSQGAGYSLHIDQVDLEEFFDILKLRQGPLLHQKNATLAFEFPEDETFFFDEQITHNVLDTVIHNALSAGAHHICIKAFTENGFQVIEVEDNGQGFSKEFLQLPLDQVKASNHEKNQTGIGLYLANQVLKAHQNKSEHGKVTIENGTLGGGKVRLWFP